MTSGDLVGPIYAAAVDPARIEELADLWCERIAASGSHAQAFAALEGDGLKAHIREAVKILGLLPEAVPQSEPLDEELASRNVATFALSGGGGVVSANAGARALGFGVGALLKDLPFERADVLALGREAEAMRAGRPTPTGTLRLRPLDGVRALVLRVQPGAPGGDAVQVALAQVNWPESLGTLMGSIFSVTPAEIGVLKSICLGASVKEIADERGLGVATVRSQVHALLSKTETRSQGELISMTMGLANLADGPTQRKRGYAGDGRHFSMVLKDGRRLDWVERAALRGRPLMWLPADIGLTHWTPQAEEELARRGIRMIAPIRAGYGFSSPSPKGADIHRVAVADTLALMDHLKIARAAFVTLGDDFRIGVNVAHASPRRVAAIMAFAPGVPASLPEHFAQMGKWARFMRANARYAPGAFGFVVRSGMRYAGRIGAERFLNNVFGGSKPDLDVLADPAVSKALLSGTEISISRNVSAHDAFAAEGIAFQVDWSAELESCPAPVTLIAGRHDPFTPFAILREYAARLPQFKLVDYPDDGYFAPYTHWREVLEIIDGLA